MRVLFNHLLIHTHVYYISFKLFKMKKTILLFLIVIMTLSCQNNTTEQKQNIGEILSGNNKGSTYSLGSMDDAQLALDWSHAFTVKDFDFMTSENFTDSVFFYPPNSLKRVDMDIPTLRTLVTSMHDPYDSISRSVYDVVPLIPSFDEELTVVMFPFTETRYRKDGEIENYRFFERHYIRGGKVRGVRKWSQEEE
ncbi:MAG: hypothetical protein CMD13_00035 [Flavobacteriales bacterium]|nr:hypothetical protein [Flavobacteriales bacterium]